jgi:ABC-type siderophore export system fused ATPase/permease subunit
MFLTSVVGHAHYLTGLKASLFQLQFFCLTKIWADAPRVVMICELAYCMYLDGPIFVVASFTMLMVTNSWKDPRKDQRATNDVF